MNKDFLLRFFVTLGSLGIYVVPFLIGLGIVFFWFNQNLLAAADPESKETRIFEIREGWDIDKISAELHAAGFTNTDWSVSFLSSLKDSSEGAILAGEYSISPALTPREILAALMEGNTIEHELELPSGLTTREAARLIAKANLAPESELYEAMRNHSTMVRLGVPSYIPEGYILGGKYKFRKPISAQQIVVEIVTESIKQLDQQLDDWKTRATALGFSPYEILILASLVEKQTDDEETRKILSSIFHNRLRIGMELESLPAIRYTLPDSQEKITREDILAPGPYNLFQKTGLPPTPICTPSFNSITAALYPADTDYLYFMKAPDGSYVYSETGSEHRANLEKYGRLPSQKEPTGLTQLE